MIMISASSPLTYFTLSIHFPKFWNELTSSVSTRSTGQVKDNNSGGAILNVRGNQRMKPFLASSVPKLHPEHSVVNIDGFGYEINPNSGLALS
jgi:hypothetical protein